MQTFLVLWFPDVALHHSGLTVVYLRHQPSEHLHTYSLINIYRLKNSKKEGTKKIFYLSIKGFSSILPETKSRFTTSEMKNHPSTFTQKFTSQKLSFSSSPHCLFCLSLFLTFIIIICSTSPFIWIHYLQSVESFAYFFFVLPVDGPN